VKNCFAPLVSTVFPRQGFGGGRYAGHRAGAPGSRDMPKMVLWKWLLLLASLLPGLSLRAEVVVSTDEETGLRKWHLMEGGFEVELVQRLPDQTRGFFLARGFSGDVVGDIATSCIFQTIIRNRDGEGGGKAITVDLTQWRVHTGGKEQGIRLKEPWIASWPESSVGQASRLAFRWALFPTWQEFLPGDYNWGMTAFGVKPGSVFDLDLVWRTDGRAHRARINSIECPPDLERRR